MSNRDSTEYTITIQDTAFDFGFSLNMIFKMWSDFWKMQFLRFQ